MAMRKLKSTVHSGNGPTEARMPMKDLGTGGDQPRAGQISDGAVKLTLLESIHMALADLKGRQPKSCMVFDVGPVESMEAGLETRAMVLKSLMLLAGLAGSNRAIVSIVALEVLRRQTLVSMQMDLLGAEVAGEGGMEAITAVEEAGASLRFWMDAGRFGVDLIMAEPLRARAGRMRASGAPRSRQAARRAAAAHG